VLAPVVTDFELDTISLLSGLEDLNIGAGVALGAARPGDLARGRRSECRIAGGTRITDSVWRSSRSSRSFSIWI